MLRWGLLMERFWEAFAKSRVFYYPILICHAYMRVIYDWFYDCVESSKIERNWA